MATGSPCFRIKGSKPSAAEARPQRPDSGCHPQLLTTSSDLYSPFINPKKQLPSAASAPAILYLSMILSLSLLWISHHQAPSLQDAFLPSLFIPSALPPSIPPFFPFFQLLYFCPRRVLPSASSKTFLMAVSAC